MEQQQEPAPEDDAQDIERLLGNILGGKLFDNKPVSDFAKSVHFESLKLRVGKLIVEIKSPADR